MKHPDRYNRNSLAIRFNTLMSQPVVLIVAFLLLMGPFALNYHFHYPDEMYYTDGAILMQQNDDYFTPRFNTGEFRFNKPILTYYFVLLGYEIFGVSSFSSRLLFLLAGGGVVGLVFLIGRLISDKKETGLLAALIAGTHPTILLSSSRSIPDILLALFLTLSALGITGLIKYGNRVSSKYLWAFYTGLALAFEVKGLPAVALGGIAWLYLLLNRRTPIRLKTLLHWPSILVSALLAFWWFGVMLVIHRSEFISGFMNDQVGVRFVTALLHSIQQFGLAILLLAALFVPWFFILVRNGRSTFAKAALFSKPEQSFFAVILIWMVLIVAMGALVTKFYERYLLPVIPVVSVGLAMLLQGIRFEEQRFTRIWNYLLIVINAILVFTAILLAVQLKASFLNWTLILVILLLITGLAVLFKSGGRQAILLALNIWLAFAAFSLVTGFISLPDQSKQVAHFMEKKKLPPSPTVAFVGNQYHGSRIRLGLNSDCYMAAFPEGTTIEQLNDFSCVIADQLVVDQLPSEKYTVEVLTSSWDQIPVGDMLVGLFRGQFDNVYQKNKKCYYWIEKAENDPSIRLSRSHTRYNLPVK